MNYDDTKAAALSLEPKEQDKLMMELAAAHVKRKATALATGEHGWKQWLWRGVAAAVGVGAALACSSCAAMTPKQTAQLQGAHAVYHAVTGKPCVFVIESK